MSLSSLIRTESAPVASFVNLCALPKPVFLDNASKGAGAGGNAFPGHSYLGNLSSPLVPSPLLSSALLCASLPFLSHLDLPSPTMCLSLALPRLLELALPLPSLSLSISLCTSLSVSLSLSLSSLQFPLTHIRTTPRKLSRTSQPWLRFRRTADNESLL